MKKFLVSVAVAISAVSFSSCGGVGGGANSSSSTSSSVSSSTTTSTSAATGGSVLGSILGATANGETLGNVLSSVLGIDRITQKNLIGTWKYKGPGCAFTSENTLAKAGGEIAATQVKEKMASQYSKLGFSSSNTYITFDNKGSFSAKLDGKSIVGKYSYNENTGEVQLSTLLLNDISSVILMVLVCCLNRKRCLLLFKLLRR